MIRLDFSNTLHNIEDIPDNRKVIDHFNDLKLLAHILDKEDDLPQGVDADKVLRYLIYMFDAKTPVKEAYPDINQRKRYVLKKLNLEANENDKSDGYGQMCLMNQPWIIERFIAFTSLISSEDYGILETALTRIGAMQKAILSLDVSKATDDKNYQEGLERWRETATRARERIMQDEQSLALQRSLTFVVSAQSLGIRPEEYSRVWREKKDIFPEIMP